MGKGKEPNLGKKLRELVRKERQLLEALCPFKCFTDSAKLPQVAFFMNEKRPYIHYINKPELIGQWSPTA